MFITNVITAAVAAATLASAPAPHATLQPVSLAKGATFARLVTPLAQAADPVLDGRIWHCEGATCQVGAFTNARPQSVGSECSTAARKLGAFEFYQTGSTLLDGDALAKCNSAAKAR